MAGVPLTRDKINNFTFTLLLRRNGQHIGNRIHPTTAEIRMENRMLTLTLQTLLGRRFQTLADLEIFEVFS